jgi:hypothetical protein
MTAIESLRTALTTLGLKTAESRLETVLEQAAKKESSYGDFLLDVFGAEVDEWRGRGPPGVGKTHRSVALADCKFYLIQESSGIWLTPKDEKRRITTAEYL